MGAVIVAGGTDGCGAPVSGLQLQRNYFFGWLVLGQENFLWEYCNVWPLLVVNLSSQICTGTLKKKKAAFCTERHFVQHMHV